MRLVSLKPRPLRLHQPSRTATDLLTELEFYAPALSDWAKVVDFEIRIALQPTR